MTKDFAEFLDALNKNGASYVVIGDSGPGRRRSGGEVSPFDQTSP